MKFKRMLFMFVLISSMKRIYCCSPNRCKKIDNRPYCAILYEQAHCYGTDYEVPDGVMEGQDQDPLVNPAVGFRAAVVKTGCILNLYSVHGSEGKLMSISGVNLGFYGGFTQVYKRFSAITCSCNTYRGCINPKYLKPRTKDGKSMCAIVYEHATVDPNTSCFGRSKEIYNGERMRDFGGVIWNDEISAVIVREGCTLTGYRHNVFTGSRIEFKGVTAILKYMNDGISSYICECEFPAVECIPSESWKKIIVCSNPDDGKTTCEYWVSQGVSLARTTTSEHGVTQNIGLTFGVELAEIFKLTSFTSNTAYSWKTSTAFSKTESEETKTRVTFEVPAGETYALYQLWGQCGQSDVKTHYYEVRNERNGGVIERKGGN